MLMIFLSTYINYATRSNISISLPAMVKVKSGFIAECKKDEKLISNATTAHEEDVSICF